MASAAQCGAAAGGDGSAACAPPPILPDGLACPDGVAPAAGAAGRPASAPAEPKRQRLVGLDMLRGLTMVVMLVVDYTGGCFPGIDHAPWDGVHLADFVMPFFLWVSGVSMSISLRVRPGQTRASVFGTAMKRAIRLFLLGVFLQGPVLEVRDGIPTVNVNLVSLRWMGILQRIAIVFAIVAAVELFIPELPGAGEFLPGHGKAATCSRRFGVGVFRSAAAKWAAVLAVWAVGTVLTYGVRPPASWPGCAAEVFTCTAGAEGAGTCAAPDDEAQLKSMGCSGPGFLDSWVMGVRHCYKQGSDVAAWPPTFAFDPEGLVTTLSAVPVMFLGLHAGRVYRAAKEPLPCLMHWASLGAVAVAAGMVVSIWVPFNKRLWSPSYGLLTGGLATMTYAAFFAAVDAAPQRPCSAAAGSGAPPSDGVAPGAPAPPAEADPVPAARAGAGAGARARVQGALRVALAPLQWLGANCILFFVLSDCSGLVDFVLRSITWGYPRREHNIVYWFQNTVLMQSLNLGAHCSGAYKDCGPAVMAFIWVELVVWALVCGVLFYRNIFWKI